MFKAKAYLLVRSNGSAKGKLFSLKIKRKIFLFICFYKISFFAVRFFQYLIKNDIKKNVKCGETTDIKIIVSIFEPTSMYHFLKKSPGYLSELLLKKQL